MSDKGFENKLVECFRHVNKNVVQVNVFPAFNKTYVARVYLKMEESGKDFIVDFPSKREFLQRYFKDNNNIKFNINVDDKTMKRIKQMQKRAGYITANIKIENDNLRKAKRPRNQLPLVQSPGGIMIPPGGPIEANLMGMNISRNMPRPTPAFMPSIHQPQGVGITPMKPIAPQNLEEEIKKFIQDKPRLMEEVAKDPSKENYFKSSMSNCVRTVLEKNGFPTHQAYPHMNSILRTYDIGAIIDFMAHPRDIIAKIKSSTINC